MTHFKDRILRSRLSRVVLLPLRARTALAHNKRFVVSALSWLWRSREHTNYSYDLEPLNLRYLAAFIGEITGVSDAVVEGYFEEILRDDRLRAHLRERSAASPYRHVADREPRYGRRIGWYAFIRATKPRVAIETGVDKGLGTCVIAAALQRNDAEGHPGHGYSTDINPAAGYLLGGDYARYCTILYGDSLTSLRTVAGPVDLFINDSDHSADYEMEEYRALADRLSPGALVLGDNAHVTDRLLRFAGETGRRFLFFQERPKNHWYPGGGIGVAFAPHGHRPAR
jgi:predicted O-methyltransferase YrrM